MAEPPTIWVLPMRPLANGPTLGWYDSVPKAIRQYNGWGAITVSGTSRGGEPVCDGPGVAWIHAGDFDGVGGEWEWKAEQAANLSRLWPMIGEGDAVLHMDGCSFAPLTVAALVAATNRKVYNFAYWHTHGHEFGKSPMGRVAECAMMNVCDLTMVCGQEDRVMVRNNVAPLLDPVAVGWPIEGLALAFKAMGAVL